MLKQVKIKEWPESGRGGTGRRAYDGSRFYIGFKVELVRCGDGLF